MQPSAEVSFTAGRSPVPLISAMEAAAATRSGDLAPRAAVGLARRAVTRCAGATREAETAAIVSLVVDSATIGASRRKS